MNRLVGLCLILCILGIGCQKDTTWTGFYHLGGLTSTRYVSEPFKSIEECKMWALHVLRSANGTTGKDVFECSRNCEALKDNQYRCDGNDEFFGTFTDGQKGSLEYQNVTTE